MLIFYLQYKEQHGVHFHNWDWRSSFHIRLLISLVLLCSDYLQFPNNYCNSVQKQIPEKQKNTHFKCLILRYAQMCNTQVFINWGQSFTFYLQGPETSCMEMNNLKSQHTGVLAVNWWVWIIQICTVLEVRLFYFQELHHKKSETMKWKTPPSFKSSLQLANKA